jgi:hypothetical protein
VAGVSGPGSAELRAAADQITDLVHDLGKYVHLSARMLAPDATLGDRWSALREDLLETRRGPSGVQTAAAVYAERRAALPTALNPHPAVHALDTHMVVIIAESDALVGLPGPDAEERADRLTTAARGAQAACRALQAALRSS